MITTLIAAACGVAFFALGWWWRGQAEAAKLLWREYWQREIASLPPEQVTVFVNDPRVADGEQTGDGRE